MWKQFVKDYLCFNKGERRAVLVLLALTLLVFVLPWCWPSAKPAAPDKQVLQELERQMAQGRQPGSSIAPRTEHANASFATTPNAHPVPARLFYFDPNTLAEPGWKALGLRDKTIQTILHYREKGGHFRQPGDLGKIYGLYPDEYARLLPYIKIEQPPPAAKKEYSTTVKSIYAQSGGYSHKTAIPHGLDINAADTLAFTTLPGIGSRLAARIVHFRDKLGGFYSVEQVGETYALPDSVFEQIKILLRCDSTAVHRLDINTADANTLRQHPYIRWNTANAIVEYRRQHGDYKSVEQLLKIEIITPELFQKISPYLTISGDK